MLYCGYVQTNVCSIVVMWFDLSFSHCRCYHVLMFHQQYHYSSCLLLCVIHYCSSGWCCGTLLYCEDEMWLPEVLLSDNSPQTAEATTSTSVWWYCWPVSEHWTEGECRIRPCAAVMTISDYSSYTETLFSIIGLVSVNQCHALVCGWHSRNWLL